MNSLARVKLSNRYDLVRDDLTQPTGSAPITNIDGTTILLLDNGTSWQYTDSEWEQIELQEDTTIVNSIFPFLASVCDSIDNYFTTDDFSVLYEGVTLSWQDGIATISGLVDPPLVKVGDYALIETYTSEYLTKITAKSSTSISFDNTTGENVRITGEAENVAVSLVSFPSNFLNAALDMLGYNMFSREAKEKRQERLGNYTYTNFEPVQYYGSSNYPKDIENIVKSYEIILL